MATRKVFDILVAEDNADDLFLLQEAFKKSGLGDCLHSVSNGIEVCAYLQGRGSYADRTAHPFPHILLLDLNMPRMNGFEVLEWLRKEPPNSRLMVYVFSASARDGDVERAYELGAKGYITKPTGFNELLAFVSALSQWHCFTTLAPRPADSPRPVEQS